MLGDTPNILDIKEFYLLCKQGHKRLFCPFTVSELESGAKTEDETAAAVVFQ